MVLSTTLLSVVFSSQILFKDEMSMIYIPAGQFHMGSEDLDSNERPVYSVNIDSYWIDKIEVSIFYYIACMNVGACSAPKHPSTWSIKDNFTNKIYENYPAVFVDWSQVNYCCS